MSKEIMGADINAVLQVCKSLSDDGDIQLGTLAHALAIACKSCGVTKATAVAQFSAAFDEPHTLVPWGKSTN